MRYSDKDIIVISGNGRWGVIFIRHGGERRHGKKKSLADLINTADEKPVVWTPPPPPPQPDLPYCTASIPYKGKCTASIPYEGKCTASIPYKGKKKSLADLINTADEKPVVWTPPPPPPPPDPPNPDF